VNAINPLADLPDTLSDREFLEALANQTEAVLETLISINGRLDHLDEGVHALDRKISDIAAFIDEHKPALARGLSLMDPGAKLRGFLKGAKHDHAS
jgi:hypothetical protein